MAISQVVWPGRPRRRGEGGWGRWGLGVGMGRLAQGGGLVRRGGRGASHPSQPDGQGRGKLRQVGSRKHNVPWDRSGPRGTQGRGCSTWRAMPGARADAHLEFGACVKLLQACLRACMHDCLDRSGNNACRSSYHGARARACRTGWWQAAMRHACMHGACGQPLIIGWRWGRTHFTKCHGRQLGRPW